MERVHALVDKARKELDKYPIFQTAQDKTGVPKEYLAGGGVLLFVGFLFLGVGASLICNLAGFVYPAYMSFKAIESPGASDDTQWLTYWVVYSFFSLLEVFADVLLYWIPFYYAFKLAFLAWCFLPATQGAAFIYESVLRDILKSGDSKMDAALKGARKTGTDVAGAASDFKAGYDKATKST